MNKTQSVFGSQGVYPGFVTQVYRFHLARRGNERDAEQLTRATFKSISLHDRGEKSPDTAAAQVTLFRAALRQQGGLRHDWNGASLSEGDPNETQSALFNRARLAALADYWATLPGWQANVIALASFGGLDSRAVSRVTRRGLAEIEAILTAQAGMLQELAGLASQTDPPASFIEALEAELIAGTGQSIRTPLADRLEPPDWLAELAAKPAVRVAAGSLVALLLAFGIWFSFHTAATAPAGRAERVTVGPAGADTASPAGDNANAGLNGYQPEPGLLVPPDQATCLHWQTALSDLVRASTPLSMIDDGPVDNPSTNAPDGTGFGCVVNISDTGPQARTRYIARIQTYLTILGYTQDSSVNTDCPKPPPNSSLYSWTFPCSTVNNTAWVSPKKDPQTRILIEMTGTWPTQPDNPGRSPTGVQNYNRLSTPSPTPDASLNRTYAGSPAVSMNGFDPGFGGYPAGLAAPFDGITSVQGANLQRLVNQNDGYTESFGIPLPSVPKVRSTTSDDSYSHEGTPAGPRDFQAGVPSPTTDPQYHSATPGPWETSTPEPGNPWASQCLRYYTDGPCQTPGANRPQPGVFIRVGIASYSLRPVIDTFLNQWAYNQAAAVDLLSPGLRASLPDLTAMDQAARIIRRPDLGVKITWRTVENTGRTVRLTFTVDQVSTLALPSHENGPYNVVFSWLDQKWQVTALGLPQSPAAN